MAWGCFYKGGPEWERYVEIEEGPDVGSCYKSLQRIFFAKPKLRSPETMGAICAVVYLLTIIVFIPFPFYKDIVAATSGGSRDAVEERQEVGTGRILHRFPHNKVNLI